MTTVAIKRALLSVSDKTGIEDMARTLIRHGVEVISTGGTAALLKNAGLDVIAVADVTGAAEMMDGRVKTLNPKIHGGILARRDDPGHTADMEREGITGIDLVVVNLYPFGQTLTNPDASREDLVENIDIGGPAMIRAAAKNHDFVTVITDAADYALALEEIAAEGGTSLATRRLMAAKAFAHTAHYDSTIAGWMRGEGADRLPKELSFGGQRVAMMRYGENPHQDAALYQIASRTPRPGVLSSEQVQGKPLSFNNINDTDAAFELVAEFGEPTVAIIKHANPCGVASHDDLTKAWDAALASDPVSAFGGIIALNRPLTGGLAERITSIFTEVVIAPDADDDAKALMAAKPNLRLLLTHGMPDPAEDGLVLRSVAGGFLAQQRDRGQTALTDYRCVTDRAPSPEEMRDMIFAMTVAKHVKSNAIVYAKDGATVGIGAGQMSRLDSSRIAARKADDLAENNGLAQSPVIGSVVASDAFFPFADGLLAAANAGATAVIQPGGSVKDDEVIKAANDAGLAMIFTGMRHFRH
ncbi:MAG: bifunctional phosphoribosylaminoimidazolecarboxamide formyltransferase/IMP cyclohydrolase [Alphaproteobacteria bacterium]|nr:bifunctional phosphoribosylaminoimidazolecarboxamide formyltransferase/IMP cyclohydrolase [Alphaproteobacteria bacterium]